MLALDVADDHRVAEVAKQAAILAGGGREIELSIRHALGHVVERFGQAPQFVTAARLHTVVEITVTEACGRSLKVRDRRQQPQADEHRPDDDQARRQGPDHDGHGEDIDSKPRQGRGVDILLKSARRLPA